MQKIKLKKGNIFYQIFNNSAFVFKAFFKDENLIFVIDETSDSTSENLRLIVNPVKEEVGLNEVITKWDTILENIYDVDLNEIRPKKNNLFQKLDIEYDGLNLYQNFIDNQNSENINKILINKEQKAHFNTIKRINEEKEILNKSLETVGITKKTLVQANEQLFQFSEKLKAYKKDDAKNDKQIEKVQAQVYNAIKTEKMRERRLKKAEIRVKKSEMQLDKLNKLLPIIDSKIASLEINKALTVQINTLPEIKEINLPQIKKENIVEIKKENIVEIKKETLPVLNKEKNDFFADKNKFKKEKNQDTDIELWIYVFLSLILTIFVFTSIYLNNRNMENSKSFNIELKQKNTIN